MIQGQKTRPPDTNNGTAECQCFIKHHFVRSACHNCQSLPIRSSRHSKRVSTHLTKNMMMKSNEHSWEAMQGFFLFFCFVFFAFVYKKVLPLEKKVKNEKNSSMFDRGYKLNLVAKRRHATQCRWVCALDDLVGEKERKKKILPVKGSDSWEPPLRRLLMCVYQDVFVSKIYWKWNYWKETVLHDHNSFIVWTSIVKMLLLYSRTIFFFL